MRGLLSGILTGVAFFASSAVVLAQNEMWDSYMSRIDNRPATVLVDMSLILRAPEDRFPYLVITGPQTTNVAKNGIPGPAVIEELEQVLTATDNFLTGVTAKILTGTLTYNGQRNNYYYVRDTANVRAALARMYNRNFKGYKYSLIIKHDPEWLTYRTFLYPDEATQNWMDNNRIITGLLQKGDSLSKTRSISYAACFSNDTARNIFTDFVTRSGFKMDKLHTVKTSTTPQCIVFSKQGSIMPADSLNKNTMLIRTEVKRLKGYYNGWSVNDN